MLLARAGPRSPDDGLDREQQERESPAPPRIARRLVRPLAGRQRLRVPGPAGQLRRGDSFHLCSRTTIRAVRAPGAAREAWPQRSDRRAPRTRMRPAPDRGGDRDQRQAGRGARHAEARSEGSGSGSPRCAAAAARRLGSARAATSARRIQSARGGCPGRQLHARKDHGQASIGRQLRRTGLGHHPAHRRHRFGLVRLRPNRRDASRRRRGAQRHTVRAPIERDPLLGRSGRLVKAGPGKGRG